MEASNKEKLATSLDATQIASLPDAELQRLGLSFDEIQTLRSLPPTQLSSMIPLVVAAGKQKAKHIQELLPIDPEIDVNGNRRCVFVTHSGVRCDKYGTKDMPVCKLHKHKAASVGSYFKSAKLRETYEAFITSPTKLKCDGELAMMRTMLAALVEKVNDDNLNMEVIGAVTAMCDKITVVVDRMSDMEKVTPEQLNVLMQRMVEVAANYILPEKLEAFAKEVEQLKLDKIEMAGTYMPGDVVDDVEVKAETNPAVLMQKKALLETAQMLGVTDADSK